MIRFPRMHVAQSTVNRILNVYAKLPQRAVIDPSYPEPIPGEQQLDQAIYAPKAPASADAQTANAIALSPLLK